MIVRIVGDNPATRARAGPEVSAPRRDALPVPRDGQATPAGQAVPVGPRVWVGAAAAVCALLTLATALAQLMPAHHYQMVPAAVAVVSGAWLAELTVPRWPRAVLVGTVIAAQVWLTAIGHISSNLLYLLLLTAWVSYAGRQWEQLAALVLSLGTIGLGVAIGGPDPGLMGVLAGSGWVSWAAGVVAAWLGGRLVGGQERLVRDQERLVAELQRLRREAERRAHELSTLLTVSRSVASTLELQPLLDRLLDELKAVVDYTGTAVLLVEGDALIVAHLRGPENISWDRSRQTGYPLASWEGAWNRLAAGEPVIIADVQRETREARVFRRLVGEPVLEAGHAFIRSCLWVPLVVRERTIGVLSITGERPGAFTPHDAELALVFASHAAVAIENARLYAQAQQTAGLEERQRLARELHDSVSQALYGIALGARTARTQLERDPSRAKEPVEYVLQLAEAGIAEMRALIFELRPESLAQEGLAAALEKHAASLRARYQLAVETDLGEEPETPLPVKEALYRIAQEALHNTVKHAQAQHVWLRLAVEDGAVVLETRDDGTGFDTGGEFPGHLGLRSMRERVERLGGSVVIESAPGAGTRVKARVPRRVKAV